MSEAQPQFNQRQLKQAAALYALDTFIQSQMHVGLGSGSTAEIFVEELGRRVNSGQLSGIITVSTSDKVTALARTFGLTVVELDQVLKLDVTVDGADEIEPVSFGLTKGRGGALLREKLVAAATDLEVIIADESKLVTRLGEKMPVPVEVIPFGWHHTAARLRQLGCNPVLRLNNEKPYLTDGNNYVLDCEFTSLAEPGAIAQALKGTVGVVEHGLFLGIARRIIIAAHDGVYEVKPPGMPGR